MSHSNEKIDFIGIAAPRCGSSWISECLRRHPQVDFPIPLSGSDGPLNVFSNWEDKEMNFFCVGEYCDRNVEPYSTWDKGLDWYLGRFPQARPGVVRGEFSPDYFCYSGAAEAIHRVMPEAKLLVVLRNPPDMLESVSRLRGNTGFHNGMTFIETVERGLYLERGFYFKLLSPFYGLFPRENIHVVLYDDIVSDPAVVMSNLFRFLGIDDRFVPPALRERVNAIRRPKPGLITSSVNLVLSAMRRAGLSGVADAVATHRGLNRWYVRVNSVEMSPGVIPSAIRERLKVYYREDIIALQGLIDRDLSAWL